MLERVVPADVLGGLADYHRQFNFVIDLTASPGNEDRIVRIIQRGARLDEQDRRLGQRRIALLCMLAIVEPDAENVGGNQRRQQFLNPHSPFGDAVRAEKFPLDEKCVVRIAHACQNESRHPT